MARNERAFDVAARVAALVGLAVAVYCWLEYAGPFRWLAELQIAIWDGYRPLLTGVLTLVLLTALPVTLAYVLLVRLRLLEAFDPARLDPARLDPGQAPTTTRVLPYFMAAALGLGLSAVGVHELWRGRGSDQLRSYEVSSLADAEPAGRYVTLSGLLAAENAFAYAEQGEQGRSTVEHTYVPLVPPGWTKQEAVRFLVEYQSYEGDRRARAPSGDARVTGTLHAMDVPGFIREHAALHLAPRHYVLVPGEVPAPTRASGLSLIAFGLLLGAFLATATALLRRWRRQTVR
jgi:hypothetical protein